MSNCVIAAMHTNTPPPVLTQNPLLSQSLSPSLLSLYVTPDLIPRLRNAPTRSPTHPPTHPLTRPAPLRHTEQSTRKKRTKAERALASIPLITQIHDTKTLFSDGTKTLLTILIIITSIFCLLFLPSSRQSIFFSRRSKAQDAEKTKEKYKQPVSLRLLGAWTISLRHERSMGVQRHTRRANVQVALQLQRHCNTPAEPTLGSSHLPTELVSLLALKRCQRAPAQTVLPLAPDPWELTSLCTTHF